MNDLFWLAAAMRAAHDAATKEQREIAMWWGVYEAEQLAKQPDNSRLTAPPLSGIEKKDAQQ